MLLFLLQNARYEQLCNRQNNNNNNNDDDDDDKVVAASGLSVATDGFSGTARPTPMKSIFHVDPSFAAVYTSPTVGSCLEGRRWPAVARLDTDTASSGVCSFTERRIYVLICTAVGNMAAVFTP